MILGPSVNQESRRTPLSLELAISQPPPSSTGLRGTCLPSTTGVCRRRAAFVGDSRPPLLGSAAHVEKNRRLRKLPKSSCGPDSSDVRVVASRLDQSACRWFRGCIGPRPMTRLISPTNRNTRSIPGAHGSADQFLQTGPPLRQRRPTVLWALVCPACS